MTSRERVRAVLNGQTPDYAPNGLGGCETAGMHVLAYYKLLEALELPVESEPPKICTFMTNAVFEIDAIKKMRGDIILLASPRMCKSFYRNNKNNNSSLWKEQILWDKKFMIPARDIFTQKTDGSVVWETAGNSICPKGGYFFDWLHSENFYDDFDIDKINGILSNYHPPHELSEELLRDLENSAKFLYEETDLSICLGETITDLQIQPGGMTSWLILLKERPEIMREFLDRSVRSALSQLKQLNQAVGKYIDILSVANDFGDNRDVLIGADLWREIYKQPYLDLFGGWKKITGPSGMKINFHTCGSVYNIMQDLIDCGVDIINPVQISADNMQAEKIKSKFGDKIILWGGAYDPQLFDISESYGEVYKKVSDNINILKKNGGFIFSGVHNLPPEMPKTHIAAMLDAWSDNK